MFPFSYLSGEQKKVKVRERDGVGEALEGHDGSKSKQDRD